MIRFTMKVNQLLINAVQIINYRSKNINIDMIFYFIFFLIDLN